MLDVGRRAVFKACWGDRDDRPLIGYGLRMRTLTELVDTNEPGWPVVEQMIANAKNRVEVLPAVPDDGARTLVSLQVTTRSPMGAIAYQTGGLLIDHGWIRLLGSGHPRLPRDLWRWNCEDGDSSRQRLPGALLIADDAVGGFFALNGDAFQCKHGSVFYLAPDTLRWEDLDRGYTDFINFLFVGDLEKFYGPQRWRGWEADVEALAGDRAFNFYPFLWTECPGGLEARSRRDVPIESLWGLNAIEFPKQLFGKP
jgi:hypothetical protein